MQMMTLAIAQIAEICNVFYNNVAFISYDFFENCHNICALQPHFRLRHFVDFVYVKAFFGVKAQGPAVSGRQGLHPAAGGTWTNHNVLPAI